MQVTQQASKQDILAKLAEIEDMLERATIDGDSVETCTTEITDALNTLTQAVDYYID